MNQPYLVFKLLISYTNQTYGAVSTVVGIPVASRAGCSLLHLCQYVLHQDGPGLFVEILCRCCKGVCGVIFYH